MKKTFLFICVAILLISCGKKDNIVTKIPSDAVVVLCLDGKKIPTNFELNKEDFPKEAQKYFKDIAKSYPNINSIINKFLKNQKELGIEINKKAYLFVTLNEDKTEIQTVGIFLSINKEKLDKNIELAFADFKMNPSSFLKKTGDDIIYTQPESDIIIGWNNSILIALYEDNINISKLKAFFDADSGNSILENKDFKEFYKSCKTINLWISSDFIPIFDDNNMYYKIKDLTGFDLKNNYGHIIFDASLQEISLVAKIRLNKSFQQPDIERIKQNSEQIKKDFLNPIIKKLGMPDYGSNDKKYNYSDEEIERMLKEMDNF